MQASADSGADASAAGAAHGRAHFNADRVNAVLKDPLHSRHVNMVVVADSVPDRMMKEYGLCSCHAPLPRDASRHEREQLMECRYSDSNVCPAQCAWAPEYAAGHGMQTTEYVWKEAEGELLRSDAEDEHAYKVRIRVDDFRSAQVETIASLALKLQFRSCLPWLICGLAHSVDTTARQCGAIAVELFSKHPDRETHDDITWSYIGHPILRGATHILNRRVPRS